MRFGAALALAIALFSSSALAQGYPSGPIRILVGFGPGSTADTLARLVGKHMEQKFGQAVVVENRPGNSSMIAAETVARAAPDGLTLFMATVAQTLNPVQTKSGFDLNKQMEPVALLGVVPNMLVAHPDVPVKNLGELVALAKAKPDSLTLAPRAQAPQAISPRNCSTRRPARKSSRCIIKAAATRR